MGESATASLPAPGPAPTAETQRSWDGKTRNSTGIRFLFWLFCMLGPLFASVLLYPVAAYYLLVARNNARGSRDYLRRRFPEAGWFRLRFLNYRHFLSFSRILLDRAYAFAGMLDRFEFEREGAEAFSEALKEGKGLVVVSAHLGNWELAAHGLGTLGRSVTKVPINVVWFRNEGEKARKNLERVSKNQPFAIIDSSDPLQASIDMMNALKRGEIVAIHGDRAMGGGSVAAEFLGAKAEFPSGPYVVAANTGAPLVYVFANRDRAKRYSLKVVGPFHFKFASRREREANLAEWVARYATLLEERLSRYPLQWHNFYQFWGDKQKPGSVNKS